MSVKLKSTLPKGEGNGLDAIVSELIHDPKRYRIGIIIFDNKHTDADHDSGEIVPIVRIRRVEVVVEDDISIAENLMRRSLDKRCGGETLPFDIDEDLKLAFPPSDDTGI